MASNSPGEAAVAAVNFLSIPPEIRDLVYENLLISSEPINFNRLSGPLVYDIHTGLLGLWETIPQVAQEACGIFYQRNTFVVLDGDLHSFLHSDITSWVLHAPSPDLRRQQTVNINVKAWLSKIEIFQEQSMFTDYRELGAGLRYLLACPRLQSVVIDTGRGFWRMLDDESKIAVEELIRRLGLGLRVHMEGSGYRSGVEYLI